MYVSSRSMLLNTSPPRGRIRSSDIRQHLSFVEVEEPLLVGADLMDVDVVVAGLLVLTNLGQMGLRVRSADDGLGHVVLTDHLRGLLEVERKRELLRQIALDRC